MLWIAQYLPPLPSPPTAPDPTLSALAQAALALTPCVSTVESAQTVPGSAVLLEVSGQLRLWGGVAACIARFESIAAQCTHTARQWPCALAHTATAAWWFSQSPTHAHASQDFYATHASKLSNKDAEKRAQNDLQAHPRMQHLLSSLPVHWPDHARAHAQRLAHSGLHTLKDLLHLPRTHIAQRFGQALLDEIDCALGKRADMRSWYQAPNVFREQRELDFHSEQLHPIEQTAHGLADTLCTWLQGQQAVCTLLTFKLAHERPSLHMGTDSPSTLLHVMSAQPHNQASLWKALISQRLNQARIDQAVCSIALEAHAAQQAHTANSELFPGPATQQAQWWQLLDRLHARLGNGQLAAPDNVRNSPLSLPHRGTPRPLWLLNPPERLHTLRCAPRYRASSLRLLTPAERIEFGWWSQECFSRDYYIAQTQGQDTPSQQLWIYQDVHTQHWYLHGLYA